MALSFSASGTCVWKSVFLEGVGQDQPELVPQLHGVDPAVDVEDEVHLEGLRLAVEATHAVELLPLRVDVLHVEDVLEEHARHGDVGKGPALPAVRGNWLWLSLVLLLLLEMTTFFCCFASSATSWLRQCTKPL